MRVGDNEFEIETGDVIVVNPDQRRQIVADEPLRVFTVGATNLADGVIFEDDFDDVSDFPDCISDL